MKKFSKKQFSDELTSDEEFDELVTELLHVEPPASLVDTILSSVANLPLARQRGDQAYSSKDQEGLIVQHGLVQPS